MTKREKAVIDKIIDKIITSGVLVKGTDYKFYNSVISRNLIGVEVEDPNKEIVTEIRNDNLFSEGSKIRGVNITINNLFNEGSKIRGVRITMLTDCFTVETCEKVECYWSWSWRYIKSSEHGDYFPKKFAQRLYDYIEENKYIILEHNKQQGNGFGFDADELN